MKDSGGTTLETLAYDGLNRRVSQTASGTTTALYYSDQWQVLEERVGGVATTQYVWSPAYVDALIERDRDTNGDGTLDERLYAQQDANYNTTALLNTSGSVVERYAYDPFGAATVYSPTYSVLSGSGYGWVYGYQGRPLDGVSGTYNFRRREVSPTLGRPIQADPVGLRPDANRYRWEGNGPINGLDPIGLCGPPPVLSAPPATSLPAPPIPIGLAVRGGLWGIIIAEGVYAAVLTGDLIDGLIEIERQRRIGQELNKLRRPPIPIMPVPPIGGIEVDLNPWVKPMPPDGIPIEFPDFEPNPFDLLKPKPLPPLLPKLKPIPIPLPPGLPKPVPYSGPHEDCDQVARKWADDMVPDRFPGWEEQWWWWYRYVYWECINDYSSDPGPEPHYPPDDRRLK